MEVSLQQIFKKPWPNPTSVETAWLADLVDDLGGAREGGSGRKREREGAKTARQISPDKEPVGIRGRARCGESWRSPACACVRQGRVPYPL